MGIVGDIIIYHNPQKENALIANKSKSCSSACARQILMTLPIGKNMYNKLKNFLTGKKPKPTPVMTKAERIKMGQDNHKLILATKDKKT